MKSKTYIIILTLLVATASVSYAETAIPTRLIEQRKALVEQKKEIITEKKQNIQNMKDEASTTRSEIQNQKEEGRTKIEEKRKEIVQNIFGNQMKRVGSRLEATITRLEGLVIRVNSRIEKIKNAGGKTDVAEKYVAESKTNLTDAREELAKMKVVGDTVMTNVSSTTPPVKDLVNIKASSKKIEKQIQEAHKALEKAVGSLKGVSGTIPNASSTKTINQ